MNVVVMQASYWSWDRVGEALPFLLEAFVRITLVVTVLGSLIAATLGLAWAILGRTAPRWI
ncbi:MAG: hypothetical protein Q4G64_10295, partial [bacterium]|nr:hypothetical protein [bacterium]